METDNKRPNPGDLAETIWRFVRLDQPVAEFEPWVYSTPELEAFLGPELYFAVIATNYAIVEQVEECRSALENKLRTTCPARCKCLETRDRDVLNMGFEHNEFLRACDEQKRAPSQRWWIACFRCRECGQVWLVAFESRINDVVCVRRLDSEAARLLLDSDVWPPDFDEYESLLHVGKEAGRSVRFVEPLSSKSLYWTIADLARARPRIRVSELAACLQLDVKSTAAIARDVIVAEGVSITFDQEE